MSRWWWVVLVGVAFLAACTSDASEATEPPLVAADPEVHQQCQATANLLGMEVPCPTLLPEGSRPTVFVGGTCPGRDAWMAPACGSASDGAFSSIEFDRPATDVPGHLVIEAVPATVSPADVVSYPLPATERIVLTPRGEVEVAGQRGEAFDVSEESATAFGGHTVVVWSSAGHTYVAGLHGHDRGSITMNDALVAAIEMVEPT